MSKVIISSTWLEKLPQKVGNHSFPSSGPIYVISTSSADEKYSSVLLKEKVISFDWIISRNEEKSRDEILYIFVCSFSALYEWNLQKFNGIPRGLADILWNKDILKCVPAASPQNLQILISSGFKLPTTLYGKLDGLILEMELHINGIRAIDLKSPHSTSQLAQQIKIDLDRIQHRSTSKSPPKTMQNPSENEFQLAISALQVFTASDEGKEFFANTSASTSELSPPSGRTPSMSTNSGGHLSNDSLIGLKQPISGYAPRPAVLLAPSFPSPFQSTLGNGEHNEDRRGEYYSSLEEKYRYSTSSPSPRSFNPDNGMSLPNGMGVVQRSSPLESIGDQNRHNLSMSPYPASSSPDATPNFDTLKFLYSLWGLEEPVVNLKPGEGGKWFCTLNAPPFVSSPCVGYQIQVLLDLSALDILKQIKPEAQGGVKPEPATLNEIRVEPPKVEEPEPVVDRKITILKAPSYARYPEPKFRLAPFPRPPNNPVLHPVWPKQTPRAFRHLAEAVFSQPRWIPITLLLGRERGNWKIEIRIGGFERYQVTFEAINLIEALELTSISWIQYQWNALKTKTTLSAPIGLPANNDGFLRLRETGDPPGKEVLWDDLMTKVLEHLQISKLPIRLFPPIGDHESQWRIGFLTDMEPTLPGQKYLEVALRELIYNQLSLKPPPDFGLGSLPLRSVEILPSTTSEHTVEKRISASATAIRSQLLSFISQANAKVGRARRFENAVSEDIPTHSEVSWEPGSPMAEMADILKKSPKPLPSGMPFYLKCLIYLFHMENGGTLPLIYVERGKRYWKVILHLFNFATIRSAKGWGSESPNILESLEHASISLIREHWDTLRKYDIFAPLSSAPEIPKVSFPRTDIPITGIGLDWEEVFNLIFDEIRKNSFPFRLHPGKVWQISSNSTYRTDTFAHDYFEAAIARVLAAVIQQFPSFDQST